MKKLFSVISFVLSTLSYGQVLNGGQRICDNQYSMYGVTGMTFSEALNFAGTIHNEYQETLLNLLKEIKPDFKDTVAVKSIVSAKTQIFFSSKGLKYDENTHNLNLAKPITLGFELKENAYSMEALGIMNQFKAQLQNFDSKNDASFFNNLNQLKESALNLSDEKEVFTVGIPISIAINSYSYWKGNGQKWMDIFGKEMDENTDRGPALPILDYFITQKPRVNLWKLGGADAAGAVQGAIAGSALGPGGALAGGVLTSAVASHGNLVNQVISSYVSWWPF